MIYYNLSIILCIIFMLYVQAQTEAQISDDSSTNIFEDVLSRYMNNERQHHVGVTPPNVDTYPNENDDKFIPEPSPVNIDIVAKPLIPVSTVYTSLPEPSATLTTDTTVYTHASSSATLTQSTSTNVSFTITSTTMSHSTSLTRTSATATAAPTSSSASCIYFYFIFNYIILTVIVLIINHL